MRMEQSARQAWEEFKAFIEERRRQQAPRTGRDWTRESLYAERLEQYGRSALRPSP